MNRLLVSVLRWLIVLALPIFLVLSAARVLINDWYPRSEYAKPDFPLDRYGWTQSERLDLALVSIHFLNSPLPPEQAVQMLADQRMPGTQDMPLFTESELSHMTDVKRVVDSLWRVHVVAGAVLVLGLALLLARSETRRSGFFALYAGGICTVVVLALLALFVLIGWNDFFVLFHEVFFPQGNWTFNFSDSLIRLFPDKLWFDAGFLITGSTLVAGILITVAGYLLWRRAGGPGPLMQGAPAPRSMS